MKKEITYEELQAVASYVQARLPYTPRVALVSPIPSYTRAPLAPFADSTPKRRSFALNIAKISSSTS